MKKAKIMLSAIGLFSIIGGALAFKAQHRQDPKLYCTTSYNAPCVALSYTITNVGTFLYCSTTANRCIYRTLVTITD